MTGRRSVAAGKLIVSTTTQDASGPVLDGAASIDDEGRRYGALVVCVPRWHRHALVVGWRGARVPDPSRWRPGARLRRLVWPWGPDWSGPLTTGPRTAGGASFAEALEDDDPEWWLR